MKKILNECEKFEVRANAIMLAVMVLFICLTCILENTAEMLLYPLTTSGDFLASMPYFTFNFFGSEVVFQQLSSTIMVWGLGVLIVACGIVLLLKRGENKVAQYWGVGLILWGIGAIVAGVSYQAFGYELKAKGQEYVLFTSDWELAYMIFTAFATNYLLVGTAYASVSPETVKKVKIFACAHSIAYCFYMLFGSIFAIEFLISYFGFVVFMSVDFTMMLAFNLYHFVKNKDSLNKHMILSWITFAVANMGYFVCYFLGLGTYMSENLGVWFGENDVLHVLLMFWAVHVLWVLMKYLKNEK